MGLTHYWERETELDPEAFGKAVEDIQRVVQALPVRLAGRDGRGVPTFNAKLVMFNGEAGAACEPFEIHQTQFDRRRRKRFYQNVKTGHAPYDLAVKASLICIKRHMNAEVTITSDADDADWAEARCLCSKVLGYGTEFKLAR